MQENQGLVMQELVRRSNEDSRRLRSMEQRIDGIESRLMALEDGVLERTKKSNKNFAEMDIKIKLMTDDITKLTSTFEKVSRQLQTFARKQDLKEIEHMFNLLNPIRQEFITRKQIEKLHEKEEVIG